MGEGLCRSRDGRAACAEPGVPVWDTILTNWSWCPAASSSWLAPTSVGAGCATTSPPACASETDGDAASVTTPAAGKVYRSLDVDRDVRTSMSDADLVALATFLAKGIAPSNALPYGWSLWRAFERGELGVLRMEVGDRIVCMRSGRAAPSRPKGPRLDPARLPDAGLSRFIQIHADLGLADRLRAEKAHRLGGNAPTLPVPLSSRARSDQNAMSSGAFPASIASLNHAGCRPLPVQVVSGFSG